MTLKGRRVGAAQADKFVSNTSQQQAAVFDGCFGAQQAFSLAIAGHAFARAIAIVDQLADRMEGLPSDAGRIVDPGLLGLA